MPQTIRVTVSRQFSCQLTDKYRPILPQITYNDLISVQFFLTNHNKLLLDNLTVPHKLILSIQQQLLRQSSLSLQPLSVLIIKVKILQNFLQIRTSVEQNCLRILFNYNDKRNLWRSIFLGRIFIVFTITQKNYPHNKHK